MNSFIAEAKEKYTKSLLDRFASGMMLLHINNHKKEPFVKCIPEEKLIQEYGYSDNELWNKYIISLDGNPPADCFSHQNPLYLHTPRIFKMQFGSGFIYAVEKTANRRINKDGYTSQIQYAMEYAKELDIYVHYESESDVCIMETESKVEIKFKRFKLGVSDE